MAYITNLMKPLFIIGLFSIVLIQSCSSKKIEPEPSNKEVSIETVEEIKECTFGHCEIDFEECIKKALYVINDVDLNTYDSIASFYFEEVLDYVDENAIYIFNEIKTSEQELATTASKHKDKIDSLQFRIKELKTNLMTFEKERTGFVFIHTFLNKQDTLSAIVLINEDGTNSEAVLVKTIMPVDINAYTNDVKKLNIK